MTSSLVRLHAFSSGLHCAKLRHHLPRPPRQLQHSRVASSTHPSFLCTLFYVITSYSLGLKHCFLERDGDGEPEKKKTSASSYGSLRASMKKGKGKGRPLRETSAAHGCMGTLWCFLLAWGRKYVSLRRSVSRHGSVWYAMG